MNTHFKILNMADRQPAHAPHAPRALACILIALIPLAFSGSAVADEAGWYGGLNVGQSKAKIDDPRITSSLLNSGFTATSIHDDNRSTGYEIFGGYRFNQNISVEGGYFDLGKFGFTATTVPAGTLDGTIKLKGLNLDLVGTIPLTERFAVFGRVGVNNAQARDTFSGTGLVHVLMPTANKRDTSYKFGAGMQYNITEALGMRLEGERYRINDAVGNKGDVDLLSVGLVYRFGAHSSPAPQRIVAAEPVVMAPAAPQPPPPMPVFVAPPPPAPAPPMKVTFEADSLFDFGKATVKPAGKQALDKFAGDVRQVNYDTIRVTGHADRLGPHAYNLKLSTERAEAVKAYLVEAAAISPGKIEARGVDGENPVTQPGDCKGVKETKALIACLQPDRRVEVEVSGTR